MQKQDTVAAAIVGGALILTGATWLLLPALQSGARTVEQQTGVQVERARRLLASYDPGLAHQSMLLDQLFAVGAEIDTAKLQDLSDATADDYQESHASRWELFTPTDWESDPPRQVKQAHYGNIAGQIGDGVRAREELVERNERILEEAKAAVDAALAETSGDATARGHAEANRLRAVVLYFQGTQEALAAAIQRSAAQPYRARLADIVARAAEFAAVGDRVADSEIDARITALQASIAETEATLQAAQQDLATEEQAVRDMEARLAAARQHARQAQDARGDLQARGIDFSNPQGGAEFERQLLELDRTYRDAERARHAIEFGTFRGARLDTPEDYLGGSYVSRSTGSAPEMAHGLAHHVRQRALYAGTVAAIEQGLNDLRADVVRLQGMKSAFESDQQHAGERIEDLRKEAVVVFEELNRVESEAFALEESALRLLDQSAKTARAAAGFARNWVSDAREASQTMSPERAERSPAKLRQGDGWMGAHITAQAADALLEQARIYQKRFAAAQRTAEVLAAAEQNLQLKEADAAAEREKSEEARKAGVNAVVEAMTVLESAHRESGRHWTLVAQQATANHLLSLFGDAAYRDAALAAYRSAIKGRETEAAARVFATAAQRLEAQ